MLNLGLSSLTWVCPACVSTDLQGILCKVDTFWGERKINGSADRKKALVISLFDRSFQGLFHSSKSLTNIQWLGNILVIHPFIQETNKMSLKMKNILVVSHCRKYLTSLNFYFIFSVWLDFSMILLLIFFYQGFEVMTLFWLWIVPNSSWS